MLGPSTIAAGFAHSCAINTKGNLFVWGDNKNTQLTSYLKDQVYVERPTAIPLKYKGLEFKAKSVYCGENLTYVIAQTKQNGNIVLDEDELMILYPLREILQKRGTLAYFFGLVGKKKIKQRQIMQGGGMGGIADYLNDESSDDEIIKTEEAENLYVPRNQFIECIELVSYTAKKNKIHYLADRLLEEGKGHGENIILGDIEDYVLGFRQNHSKVFAFGQGHKALFSFQKKLHHDNESEEDNDVNDSGDEQEQRQRNLQKQYQNDIIIVSRPTAIKFPKHTRPIAQIACGSAHILAVTEAFEMYSWGCGLYGQLGFGTRENMWEPRKLELAYDDKPHQISGVACGKYHSLCITRKKKIYSWGFGQSGRLGHGDEDDVLVPKEINGIERGKPVFVAAGECHSACITDRLCVYTWGNGSYGRLGHGFDSNEKKPKFIEDFDQIECTYISCGAFHTMVSTGQGTVYAFGQGKYGKLGLNKKDKEGVFTVPEKISFYRIIQEQDSTSLALDKSEAVIVVASYNHSMALSKSGKVYSWGYNGKGILGRQRGFEETLPLEIGSYPGELVAKMPNSDEMLQRGEQKNEELFSFEIAQVACGQMNTVSLTNGGEIYVTGSNAYGQLCKDSDQGHQKRNKRDYYNQDKKQNELQDQISLIRFPGDSIVRVNFVACGGEHIFAITRTNELYGWGRNEEGQLGLGNISDYVNEPKQIKDLAHKNIIQVACGDNYTAAVSLFGELFVTGNMEGGRLGLGKAMRQGYLLLFTMVPKIQAIKYVACGPNHMLAISDYNPDPNEHKDGMTYAWGRNSRGQLGIGNDEDQNQPVKIQFGKELFKKVVCGQNFSMALTNQGSVYFWGNFKYFCEKVSKDFLEPTMLKSLEGKQIKDIACCQYYCLVLNDKGEILQWGKYLKEKVKHKKEGIKGVDVKTMIKFPNINKFDVLMETISTGPNHSAAVSVKKSIYTWGNAQGGRLGLKQEDAKKARVEPLLVTHIMELLQQNRQNLKEGRRDDTDDEIKPLEKEKKEDPKGGNFEEQKQKDKYVMDEDEGDEDGNENKQEKDEKLEDPQNDDEDNFGEIEDVEKAVGLEDNQPQEKLNLVSLGGQTSMIEAHMKLQKIIKKERSDQLDENFIIRFDDEILKDIDVLLKQFRKYQKLEQERKKVLVQIQSAFLQRISDTPFNVQVEPELRVKGNDPQIVSIKKTLKMMVTILHVHPCYMIKLYQTKLVNQIEFNRILKEIYSYQNDRVNYLLLAIIQKIIDQELRAHNTIEEVNFLTQDSVVGKIFKYIFKSQETNLDTLCSLGCHIVNKLLSKFSSSSTSSQDNTFDVTDSLNKGNKQFDIDKTSKNIIQSKRANDLIQFVEEIIRDIMDNEVLYPQASYFVAKKQHLEELNNKKKQQGFMAQDQQPKLESLRFSQEVSYLADMLQSKIRETPFKSPPLDDVIISKILSVIFGYLEKLWKDYEIYLFPYVKQVKGLSIIEDVIKKTHKTNLDNVFHVMNCFFRGEQVFPDYVTDGWNKELTLKLNHLQQSNKGLLLQRVIDKNPIKQISFKNFENLILHSLDSEGHTVTVRKKSLSQLYTLFMDNQDLTIVKPYTEDPLYSTLLSLKAEDMKLLAKSAKDDKMNFKMKSRLLIEEENPIVSRCHNCNAILVQKFAPPDSMTILEKYNPEDSQSLVAQYSTILKIIGEITKNDNIIEFIEVRCFYSFFQKTFSNAKKNSQFELANKLMKFMNQVELEVANIMNKIIDDQQLGGQENDEMKVKESIYLDIQKQSEVKINERRMRKYDLTNIQKRIHNVLGKKINAKVKQIQDKELLLYKVTLYNIQYGLANHELKHLADAYTLKHMRKIIDYTTSSKMSKNLFKNLRNEQKVGLRSIVKKSAKKLLQNQTITNIVLPQLKPLQILIILCYRINKCEFVFLEGDDQSISIKMIFREKKFALCGPPQVLNEAVLVNVNVSQKELLEMRKQGKHMDTQRLVLGNSIEFDHAKLMRIFNEMERSKSAYMLNSGANPAMLQKSNMNQDNRA